MDDDRMPRGGSPGASGSSSPPTAVTMVVDVANVMGSRPDGWWKDRAGAATRLLALMPGLVGRDVAGPDGDQVIIERVVAVVEGAAKAVEAPEGVIVVRAPKDGDSSIVDTAVERADAGEHLIVVTADRGLRARLPGGVLIAGPGWLNALLGR
jgi:hypothetical protein